jgi:endoglucanase
MMRLPRRTAALAATLAGILLAPAAGHAAPFDAAGFRLSSPTYIVDENAGNAVITIERTDTSREAQIRYIANPMTAERGIDFDQVKAMINFLPGQASATFDIPIIDHGVPGVPKTVKVALFGPSPIGMGVPDTAVLTILNDDVVSVDRNPTNPLALPSAPPSSDPLLGARAYVDPDNFAAVQARKWRHSHPGASRMLNVIGDQPWVERFGHGIANPAVPVADYLERAGIEQPGTVPEMSTYWLVDAKIIHPQCHHYSDSPARQKRFHNWIENMAKGIGDYRAVLFFEVDSLITVGCLSHHGLDVRLAELRDALSILSKVPRLVVYLDAGAADAAPATKMARLLRESGDSQIQGFFLNATHFDWTRKEIRYGEKISKMTGGKHFVVSTSENGRGPLVPHDRRLNGNEILCNPPGRGLGPKPTFDTGYHNVDAFAWIGNPGKSGGTCRPGAPPVGYFWPQFALQLVRDADFKVQ